MTNNNDAAKDDHETETFSCELCGEIMTNLNHIQGQNTIKNWAQLKRCWGSECWVTKVDEVCTGEWVYFNTWRNHTFWGRLGSSLESLWDIEIGGH